ncbi:unnamed protein product [Hymenolepis diminuta]|nr:unnamed protein product [Hymenolepis diminuta]
MNEDTSEDSEDFRFWLKVCTVLTVIFYTFCGVTVFLLRRIIGDVLSEALNKVPRRPQPEKVVPFSNPVAITNLTHRSDDKCLDLTLSLTKNVQMFVLRSVPLSTFHEIMVAPTTKFHQFVVDRASESFPVTTSSISVKTNDDQVPFNMYRTSYDLVLVFFDESDLECVSDEEKVIFSFHMVHVKQYEEERRPTQHLFSYCKTSLDRLICLRKIFAFENSNSGASPNRPECSVCLSEVVDVIFVPCRHSPMCQICLSGFLDNTRCLHCPICRVAIAEIKLL